MAKNKGLHPKHAWVTDKGSAQALMQDPSGFVQSHGVALQDYACPPEVHDALARGRKLGEAIDASCASAREAKLDLPASVEALRATVTTVLGADFEAEPIPYGILFKERGSGIGPSVTGTGSCTFCSDNDSPDVD